MKIILSYLFLNLVLATNVLCQKLTYYYGERIEKSKIVNPIITGTDPLPDYDYTWHVELSYPLSEKFNILSSYMRYTGHTRMALSPELVEFGWGGGGSALVQIRRFGVGAYYTIFNYNNRIKASPVINVEYEYSYRLEVDGVSLRNFYREEIDNPRFAPWYTYAEPLEMRQILPTIGLKIDLRLFWRFYFNFEWSWSFGHTPNQNFFFDHSFDGVIQPRGHWQSDGTMYLKSIGMSILLWGPVEKTKKGVTFF